MATAMARARNEQAKRAAADIRRHATVLGIERNALAAAAEALKPQPKKARPIFVIPARYAWLLPKIWLLRDRPRA
jgi:hypothetical protein